MPAPAVRVSQDPAVQPQTATPATVQEPAVQPKTASPAAVQEAAVAAQTAATAAEAISPQAAAPAAMTPSAADTISTIARGEKSCVQVVTQALAAIEGADSELHCCVDVCREASLKAAAAVDAQVAAGGPLGKLAGLPMVVKANIDVAGALSTAATPALKDWRPSSNADCVQPLLDAGAIVIAKTHMPELAMRADGWSSVHGICYNPRNRQCISGGSSSGTASAVAAGYVAVGIGSDTLGSTRLPAACCGVVGLRPSRGRWSHGGCVPLDPSKDTPGPIGATVADVALIAAAVCGDDEPAAAPASLEGVKVLIAEDWMARFADVQSQKATEAVSVARAALESAGATVISDAGICDVVDLEPNLTTSPPAAEPPRLPALQEYLDRHADRPEGIARAEQVVELMTDKVPKFSWLPHLNGGYTDEKQAAFEAYLSQAKESTEAAYRKFFADKGIQAVLVPTIPVEPPSVEGWTVGEEPSPMALLKIAKYTMSFNCCSIPSLSVPTPVAGTESGIPMSVLLWGVDDRELLSVGAALEKALK